MPTATPLPAHPERYPTIDWLRGIAMVWMTVFHWCFDLNHFGYLHGNFYADPFWTLQRTAIVSLFAFCAGLGQAVAVVQGQSWARFWKRWLQIVGCAALVSLASWWMYPNSFIYFGILHGMALMLLLVRCAMVQLPPSPATTTRRRPGLRLWSWLWLAGALAVALPPLAKLAHARWPELQVFDTPALNWLGLISRKPVTEDYAPLFPWLGPLIWGLATGLWLVEKRPQWLQYPVVPQRPGKTSALPWLTTPLGWLGRHSLSYYMLHQPVLLGLLMLWVAVVGRGGV